MLAPRQESVTEGRERRSKPRICVPFHAKVEGIDDKGEKFSIETVLDNVSGDGLYLRIMPFVEQGTKLSIVVGLNTPAHLTDDAPRFSIEGLVMRSEEKTGGAWGVAVTFDHVRFL